MTFCEKLQDALENAPNDEAKAAIQAVIDQHCGVSAQGGGNGNGPPPSNGGG